MISNHIKRYFVIILLFFLCNYSCKPYDENCKYHAKFEFPVKFEPTDSIINIGDTITITSRISNKLWDIDSTNVYYFENLSFGLEYYIYKLDTVVEGQNFIPYSDDFIHHVDSNFFVIHKTLNKVIGVDYAFDENTNEYYFEAKLIPQKKGLFLFEIDSKLNNAQTASRYGYIHTNEIKCKTRAWTMHFIINNGENYKSLLKFSPNFYANSTYFDEWDYNKYTGKHCFIVK